jgi:hypothetical protein
MFQIRISKTANGSKDPDLSKKKSRIRNTPIHPIRRALCTDLGHHGGGFAAAVSHEGGPQDLGQVAQGHFVLAALRHPPEPCGRGPFFYSLLPK